MLQHLSRRGFVSGTLASPLLFLGGCASTSKDSQPSLRVLDRDYATYEFQWTRGSRAHLKITEAIHLSGPVGPMRIMNEFVVSPGDYSLVASSGFGRYYEGPKGCMAMTSLGMTEVRSGGVFLSTYDEHPSGLWIHAPVVAVANRVGLYWWPALPEQLTRRLKASVVT